MAKVLIVEDYLDLLDFFKILLELNNFIIESASSGRELFTKLDDFKPDLILLDVMLQGEDGRDICKEIKTKYGHIAIILVSANPKLLIDYKDCLADDVIEKPFDINDVINKIRALVK